jgi:hypothetical protein
MPPACSQTGDHAAYGQVVAGLPIHRTNEIRIFVVVVVVASKSKTLVSRYKNVLRRLVAAQKHRCDDRRLFVKKRSPGPLVIATNDNNNDERRPPRSWHEHDA